MEHRLPLFLRSDLFSEYKLSKLLSTNEIFKPVRGQTGKLPSPFRSSSNTKLSHHSGNKLYTPAKRPKTEEKELSVKDITLPSISKSSSSCFIHVAEDVCRVSLGTSHRAPGISKSKSDIELWIGKESSMTQAQQPNAIGIKSVHEKGSSTDITGTLPQVSESGQSSRDEGGSIKPVTNGLLEKDAKFIGTKSGMHALWKFLQGKAGEKNWLFWLDAERVKYHSSPLDQQRYEVILPFVCIFTSRT